MQNVLVSGSVMVEIKIRIHKGVYQRYVFVLSWKEYVWIVNYNF